MMKLEDWCWKKTLMSRFGACTAVTTRLREDLFVRMIDEHGPPPPNAALFANEVLRYVALFRHEP